MQNILNKLFPEGYRKLVAGLIVVFIAAALSYFHQLTPQAVQVLLGAYSIFVVGNIAEWVSRALGDLEKPMGLIPTVIDVAKDVGPQVAKDVIGAVAPALGNVFNPGAGSSSMPGVMPPQSVGMSASVDAAIRDIHQKMAQIHNQAQAGLKDAQAGIMAVAEAQGKTAQNVNTLVTVMNKRLSVVNETGEAPQNSGVSPLGGQA